MTTPATKTSLVDIINELTPREQLPADKFALGMKVGLACGFLNSGDVGRAVKTLEDSAELARRTGVKRKLDALIAAVQGEPSTPMRRP